MGPSLGVRRIDVGAVITQEHHMGRVTLLSCDVKYSPSCLISGVQVHPFRPKER